MFESIKKLFTKEERIERENGAYDMVSEMMVRSYKPGLPEKDPLPPPFPGHWEKLTDTLSDVGGFSRTTWVNENHPDLMHTYTYTDSKTNRNIDIELAGRCDYSKAMDLLRHQVNTFCWYLTNHTITCSKKK